MRTVSTCANLRSQHATRWVLPIAIAAIAVLLHGAGADAGLDYDRRAIAAGAWWRLVTGHLVHLDGSHAALDVAALIVVAWIFSADLDAWAQVVVVSVSVIAIDATLWVLHPEVVRYAGLSGVVHAWFAAGVTLWALDALPARRRWGIALLVGLVSKLVLESVDMGWWRGGLDFPVVTAAHRWGALAGAGAGLLLRWLRGAGDVAATASPERRQGGS